MDFYSGNSSLSMNGSNSISELQNEIDVLNNTVVFKTGTQTIDGDKTFTGTFLYNNLTKNFTVNCLNYQYTCNNFNCNALSTFTQNLNGSAKLQIGNNNTNYLQNLGHIFKIANVDKLVLGTTTNTLDNTNIIMNGGTTGYIDFRINNIDKMTIYENSTFYANTDFHEFQIGTIPRFVIDLNKNQLTHISNQLISSGTATDSNLIQNTSTGGNVIKAGTGTNRIESIQNNTMITTGNLGVNNIQSTGTSGTNTMYATFYNSLTAKSNMLDTFDDNGLNKLSTTGINAINKMDATGANSQNVMSNSGVNGLNTLSTTGTDAINSMSSTGYYAINMMDASGANSSNIMSNKGLNGQNIIIAEGTNGTNYIEGKTNTIFSNGANYISATTDTIIDAVNNYIRTGTTNNWSSSAGAVIINVNNSGIIEFDISGNQKMTIDTNKIVCKVPLFVNSLPLLSGVIWANQVNTTITVAGVPMSIGGFTKNTASVQEGILPTNARFYACAFMSDAADQTTARTITLEMTGVNRASVNCPVGANYRSLLTYITPYDLNAGLSYYLQIKTSGTSTTHKAWNIALYYYQY